MMVGMRIKDWFGWIVEDRQREMVGGGRGSGVFVFLDESGDLGFGRGSSEWFVVGGGVCDGGCAGGGAAGEEGASRS